MFLRNVTPIVPENEEERAMLKDDLVGLGCGGLLVNRVNSTFGISYQVLKLVGSSMSSRQ